MTLRNLFAIDPRSLALFRIAIAVLLLTDMAIRVTDLKVMYTDDGMFSRAEICRLSTSIWNWSFHFASGSWGYEAILFGIAAVLALALLVGFETRIAVIGSWLMLVSIHHRVPPILSGAEILLRMLLFWAMFLPLSRAWALDGWLDKRRGIARAHAGEGPVVSVASAAILLQMGLLYLFSAIFKSNAQWANGEALAGILAHDFYASPAGAYLLQFPRLLSVLTRATFVLEWSALLLFLLPIPRVRLGIAGALAAMHAGMAIFLEVGFFPYVAMAGLVLFLPAQFWNCRLPSRLLKGTDGDPELSNTKKNTVTQPRAIEDIAQRLCMIFLIYVMALNINSLPRRPLSWFAPERWRPFTRGFGLSQRWGMFDSIPSKDGWYVARAELEDGSEVDLLRQGAAVDWKKPRFPARLYPNHYWQKLFREMAYDDEQGFQFLRAPVAGFLCRNWNALNPPEKQIAGFEFIYCMEGEAEAGNLSAPPVVREQLLHLDFSDPRVSVKSPAGHSALGTDVR